MSLQILDFSSNFTKLKYVNFMHILPIDMDLKTTKKVKISSKTEIHNMTQDTFKKHLKITKH